MIRQIETEKLPQSVSEDDVGESNVSEKRTAAVDLYRFGLRVGDVYMYLGRKSDYDWTGIVLI